MRGGDSWSHVHEELSLVDTKKHVEGAMARLPDAQKHIIHLTYQGQMSQRQIRSHTGIPLGTIKTRLQLGLRKLAVHLRGFEDLLPIGNRPATNCALTFA